MLKKFLPAVLSLLSSGLLIYTAFNPRLHEIKLIDPLGYYFLANVGTTISEIWGMVFFAFPSLLGLTLAILYPVVKSEAHDALEVQKYAF